MIYRHDLVTFFRTNKGMIILTKPIVSLVATALLAMPTASLADQSCTSIANDTERLACFDSVWGNSGESDPTEAWVAFSEFAQTSGLLSEDGDTSMDFRFWPPTDGNCYLQSNMSELDFRGTSLVLDTRFFNVNLSEVQEVGFPRRNYVSVTMNRGYTISSGAFAFYPISSNQLPISGSQAMSLSERNLQSNQNLRQDDDREVRTANVVIVAEKEDVEKAAELFRNLVTACANN